MLWNTVSMALACSFLISLSAAAEITRTQGFAIIQDSADDEKRKIESTTFVIAPPSLIKLKLLST